MKKFFYGAIAIIIVIATYMWLRPNVAKVESYKIRRGPFEETLISDGKVRTRDKQTVYAFATGNIDNLNVKVGDPVRKGQIVTMLEWDRTLQVKVPIDGVISRVYRESAGPILRGEPIFEVSSLSELEVIADVLTPEAIRLSVNGEARVQNWGGASDLEAKIIQISRAGTVKMSALGVEEERTEVKLSFLRIPQELKDKFGDNYHVDVLFLVSREADVLSVPLGALFKNAEKWAVYVIQDGRAHLKEIQISKKNDRFAMVTEGLSEGDQVILFPGDIIREGLRVRAEP